MSDRLRDMVDARKLGSAPRKAVLSYYAGRADKDGGNIFPSKKTVAGACELGRSTVIRVTREMLSEGLLQVTGTVTTTAGSKPVYRLNIAAIMALPLADHHKAKTQHVGVPERDGSQSGTPNGALEGVPERDGVPLRDQGGPRAGPITPIEPPKEEECARERVMDFQNLGEAQNVEGDASILLDHCLSVAGHRAGKIPTYWMPPAATLHVARWQTDLGLSHDEVIAVGRAQVGQHGPPDGPKAWDRAMAALAAEKARPGETLPKAKGGTNGKRGRTNEDAAEQAIRIALRIEQERMDRGQGEGSPIPLFQARGSGSH